MNSSNKKRLLELINILTRNSSENNPLSLNEIMQLLDTRGISNINRKTLYDDFKVLEECGYNLEKAGNYYYLSENPFSMSEIKIILDSLHSLRNIDYSFLKKLDDKLYAFLSYDEEKQLRKLEYTNRHKDDKFILRLEDVLYAIRNNETVILKDRKNRQSVIGPCFLYRDNNYYYLYYHYENMPQEWLSVIQRREWVEEMCLNTH